MKQHEHEEQKALFRWAAMNEKKYPVLRWMFAVPNGGQRSKAVAGKLKAEGVKSGVADIFLPTASKGFHGLFIELKAGRGKPTKNQIEFLNHAGTQGYMAVVCHGWVAAKETIEGYLNG